MGVNQVEADHPGPEGGEGDVVVGEGFLFKPGCVVGEESLDVLGGDLVDGGVGADEGFEESKSIPVIVQGVFTQPP